MSAVDEVRAAIRVLELQRDEPQPPYFSRWNEDDFSYGNLDDAVEEGFDYGQAYGEWKASRHLIDAQLAILGHVLEHYRGDLGISTNRHVVALARAINGTTS